MNYNYDDKVDCWSLGAVCYEVITNEKLLIDIKTNTYNLVNPTPNWFKVKSIVSSAVRGLLVVDPKQRKPSKWAVELLKP